MFSVVFLCQNSYFSFTRNFLVFLFIFLRFISGCTAKETNIAGQNKVPNCDIILHSSTSKNGSIQSPMYPGTYPAKTYCRYEFQGRGREKIQITFTEFNLPNDNEIDECEESDTLQIYVPMKGRYENVERLCGDTVPKPIMSNGPKMRLEFRGTRSGKGNRGFRADYTFLENFGINSGKQLTDNLCTFVYNKSESQSGWFHSPNFPGAYPRNTECSYYFYAHNMEKVLIRFTYFDVEGIYPCEDQSASDFVELSNFMTTDRKFSRYCGQSRDFSIRSDGRFFRITFRSNDRLDGTGFRAQYQFIAESTTTEMIPLVMDNTANSFKRISNLLLVLGLIHCFRNTVNL